MLNKFGKVGSSRFIKHSMLLQYDVSTRKLNALVVEAHNLFL